MHTVEKSCVNNIRSCSCKLSSLSPLNYTGGTQKEFGQAFCANCFETPQMWVWPKLPFGPPPPKATGGLPSTPQPSLPTPPPLPPPPWLFLQCSGRGCLGWRGWRRTGVEGEGPPNGTWGQTHIWGHSTVFSWVYSEGRELGVGSVVVEFGVFGAPRFSVQRPQHTYF